MVLVDKRRPIPLYCRTRQETGAVHRQNERRALSVSREFGLRLDERKRADMVNVNAFEVAPPGFCTVTLAVPCEAIWSGRYRSCQLLLPLTKVVDTEVLFHITVAPDTKLDPLTVRVNGRSLLRSRSSDSGSIAKGSLMD